MLTKPMLMTYTYHLAYCVYVCIYNYAYVCYVCFTYTCAMCAYVCFTYVCLCVLNIT